MIKRGDLKEYASNLTKILEGETTKSLRFGLPRRIPLNEEEFIEIGFRPSNSETRALTISYIVKNLGIPIEARINEELEYSQIIIKCAEDLREYTCFGADGSSNLMQYRFFDGFGLNTVRNEIESLQDDGER